MSTPTKNQALAELIDLRRAAAAKLAGLDLQLAMAVGDRNAAQRHMREMNAQTEARIGARVAQSAGEARQ